MSVKFSLTPRDGSRGKGKVTRLDQGRSVRFTPVGVWEIQSCLQKINAGFEDIAANYLNGAFGHPIGVHKPHKEGWGAERQLQFGVLNNESIGELK